MIVEEPVSRAARFDDLLSGIAVEAAAADDALDDATIEELERAARATRLLVDRMRAAASVRVELIAGERVAGQVVAVGKDLVIVASADGDWAIPLWGIAGVVDLGMVSRGKGSLLEGLGITAVLRSWARERSPVRMIRMGVGALDGTIDHVGADHVDVAEHDPGEARRASVVRRVVTVPLGAVVAVRRQ